MGTAPPGGPAAPHLPAHGGIEHPLRGLDLLVGHLFRSRSILFGLGHDHFLLGGHSAGVAEQGRFLDLSQKVPLILQQVPGLIGQNRSL